MRIPQLGLGTAPLGGLFSEVTNEDATATVHAALACGVRLFDTAPQYGNGLAETRLGAALRSGGVDRSQLVVTSKVGRVLVDGADPATIFRGTPPLRPVFDLSPDGIRRSFTDSLDRLGLDRLDIALLHDPDDHEAEAYSNAFPTLRQMRDEGLIGAIGVGMNQVAMLERFVGRADEIGLDMILVAGRWSLLDRTAATLLDACAASGVAVVVGGVFNSGLLADPHDGATFDYAAASPELVSRAQRFAAVCRTFDVTLTAAALQFPLRHPAVTSIVVGARTAAEVISNHHEAGLRLPDDLWPALDLALYEST